jgi:hypothetical protein
MNLERYEFNSGNTWTEFEFASEGPKGFIKKKVEFHINLIYGYPVFNLAFGDWDESRRKIDDKK